LRFEHILLSKRIAEVPNTRTQMLVDLPPRVARLHRAATVYDRTMDNIERHVLKHAMKEYASARPDLGSGSSSSSSK